MLSEYICWICCSPFYNLNSTHPWRPTSPQTKSKRVVQTLFLRSPRKRTTNSVLSCVGYRNGTFGTPFVAFIHPFKYFVLLTVRRALGSPPPAPHLLHYSARSRSRSISLCIGPSSLSTSVSSSRWRCGGKFSTSFITKKPLPRLKLRTCLGIWLSTNTFRSTLGGRYGMDLSENVNRHTICVHESFLGGSQIIICFL